MARSVVVVMRLKGWKEAGYQQSPDQLEAARKKAQEIFAEVGGKHIGAYWRHAPGGRLGVWFFSFPSVENWEEYYARVYSARQAPNTLRQSRYVDMEFEVLYERAAGE